MHQIGERVSEPITESQQSQVRLLIRIYPDEVYPDEREAQPLTLRSFAYTVDRLTEETAMAMAGAVIERGGGLHADPTAGEALARRDTMLWVRVYDPPRQVARADVTAMLDRLPSHLRLPLVLNLIKDRTVREIKRRTGIGQATASRRIEDALGALAKMC